jgi:hypothetical protein
MNYDISIKKLRSLIITLIAFTVMTTPSFAAVFNLRAETTTLSMPDGAVITMWGFALGKNPVTIPGPTLEVPPGDNTLTIVLTNNLPDPISVIIPGQASSSSPVWFTDPQGRRRARSFTAETSPATTGTYTWNNLKPGTYLYHSGTHPAVQVQMGLYGAVKKDDGVNNAYPGVNYDSEVVLLFSEIDPVLHTAVVNGTYGTAAYPSTIDYKPQYFLINGEPYSATRAPLLAGSINQTVLIRFLNAGLKNHVPLLQDGYMSVIAENGNPYPYPKEQYSVLLPAGNTIDALWTPTSNGIYPVYDRRFYLRSAGVPEGGMLVYLYVADVAGAPLAIDDSYTVPKDKTLSIIPPGVLANDTDADGDPLTAILVTDVQNGVLTLNSDGSFTYNPTLNFDGVDSFTYKCNDGTNDSNVATVTITVIPPNFAPIAVNDSDITTINTPVTTDVLANDSDVENDPLTVSIVSPSANGTLAVNADNTVTYTPNTGFTGTDSYTYVCNDGIDDSNVATVTITVVAQNSAPVAVADTAVTNEDTAVIVDVLANDSDVDGNVLTVSSVTQGANGSVFINMDETVTYTPDPDFNGSDSFTYMANDGILDSNPATVTITVNAVNDAPVAVNDTAGTTAGVPVAIDVLVNDTDVDGDVLSVSGVTQGASGTVSINANNTVTYTPNTGFTGTDTFTYTAFDGTSNSNNATVTITVVAQNIAPVAVDDTAVTNQGTAVIVNVLANDSDADGDALTVSSVTQGTNGSVSINADETVTYIPDPGFSGSDSFTYMANDGIADSNPATVTITVNAVNSAPVALNDSASTTAGVPVIIDVLANDTDVDGDVLSVSGVTQGASGTVIINADNTVTYTPNTGITGTDTFTYTAFDGTLNSNTATVTITVNPPAAMPPVAVDDAASTTRLSSVTIDLTGNDYDPDGTVDLTTVTIMNLPHAYHGTLVNNGDGTVTFTSTKWLGTTTFTYTVRDNEGITSNEGKCSITVGQ